MKNSAIAVFCKLPVKGVVKTRLASETNEDFATRLYEYLLKNLISTLNELSDEIDIFYYLYNDTTDQFEQYLKNYFSFPVKNKFIQIQHGRDLGERMMNAFYELFKKGYKKVIIIGSDIIGPILENVSEALKKLDIVNYIIGPSLDGGFYLIGAKEFISNGIFNGINWSTSTVLEALKNNLRNSNKEYNLLEPILDIDHLRDIRLAIEKDLLSLNLVKELGLIL